jgi:hypothetical protein
MNTRTIVSVFASAILTCAGIVAFAGAGPLHASKTYACLAVGQGVCLSGTTEWVAEKAAAAPRPYQIALAMDADAN